MTNRLQVRKLHNDAVIPTRNKGDAGYDLYVGNIIPIPLEKGFGVMIPTDIAMEIPDGYVGILKDRSSIGSKGIHILAGVIDSSYRGNIKVCFANIHGDTFLFKPGMKIAQIIIVPYYIAMIDEVDTLDSTDRNEKGFGSTDSEKK